MGTFVANVERTRAQNCCPHFVVFSTFWFFNEQIFGFLTLVAHALYFCETVRRPENETLSFVSY